MTLSDQFGVDLDFSNCRQRFGDRAILFGVGNVFLKLGILDVGNVGLGFKLDGGDGGSVSQEPVSFAIETSAVGADLLSDFRHPVIE